MSEKRAARIRIESRSVNRWNTMVRRSHSRYRDIIVAHVVYYQPAKEWIL